MPAKTSRLIEVVRHILFGGMVSYGFIGAGHAGEPNPKTYWEIDEIRPGMKGTGQTVMVGTKLEEFGAEVLGVMRDVREPEAGGRA